MKLLLDTHTFLWFIGAQPELSSEARQLVEEARNERFVSVASLWEMAIKVSTGKLELLRPLPMLVSQDVFGNDMQLLQILPHHLDVVSRLPFHHRDPFDRMLAAQSLADGLTLLSRDEALDAYGVDRRW